MELDALLATVSESIKKSWRVERFDLLFTWPEKTWWGAVRRTIVADVGWERARLAVVVRETDGKVLGATVVGYPVPREKLPVLSDDALMEIARADAQRLGWPFRGRIFSAHEDNGWRVSTNVDRRGSNVHMLLDERTGVVLKRLYWMR